MKTIVRCHNLELWFTDSDIVNPDDAIWQGEYNPHNVRLFLLHDHGIPLAVVWADCLQDAIDIAVDADKLDRYQVSESDAEDYGGDIYNCESLSYLGNASEPFDIESLGYAEFGAPRLSLVALCGESVQASQYHC